MAYIPNQQNIGVYNPTTRSFDTETLNSISDVQKTFRDFQSVMYQNFGDISRTSNYKDNGLFVVTEQLNGQQWYNPDNSQLTAQLRSDFRKVIIFGSLPAAGTKSIAHGINVTTTTLWTRILGTATDPVGLTGFSFMYSGTTSEIYLTVDANNVNVTTTADYSNYTECVVVIEYLKY